MGLKACDVSDHHGAQGLAQLGRNAIERVSELERELAAVTAERDAYRDEFSGLCLALSVGSEGSPEMTAVDWRKRVDDGIEFLTRPLTARIAATDVELAKRSKMLDICTQNCSDWIGRWQAEKARVAQVESRLADLETERSRCLISIENLAQQIAERDSEFVELRARLAALAELERAAAEPVAWMWDDELGVPHASAGSKKPTWLESSASAEYVKQANLRPLYATPPPAPVAAPQEDARKYCEAQREVSRLREMLYAIVNRCEGQAKEIALAALEET